MSTAAEKIAALEAILDEGAREVSVDGRKVVYDFAEIRRRLSRLRREQDATARPRVASIDLSSFGS